MNRDGRGTRVEFHRLNQSQVTRPHQRVVSFRTLNVRHWDQTVDVWAADDDAMDEVPLFPTRAHFPTTSPGKLSPRSLVLGKRPPPLKVAKSACLPHRGTACGGEPCGCERLLWPQRNEPLGPRGLIAV